MQQRSLIRIFSLALPLVIFCATAVSAQSAALPPTVSTADQYKDRYVKTCKDQKEQLGDGNNTDEVITGRTLYAGERPIHVLKHRSSASDTSWDFWMRDYTTNCSEIHFYPDDYQYSPKSTGKNTPLFTGPFEEAIGDGEDYERDCCDPETGLPRQNALTSAADISNSIGIVWGFYAKFDQQVGVDPFGGAAVEVFNLHAPKSGNLASYDPSKPSSKDAAYTKQRPLYHQLTVYQNAPENDVDMYVMHDYLEVIAHELRHAHWFSTVYGGNRALYVETKLSQQSQMEEDFAQIAAMATKNWGASGQGSTLCGEQKCRWTANEQSFKDGEAVFNYENPQQYEDYAWFYPAAFNWLDQPVNQAAGRFILGTTFHGASEGLTKCSNKTPDQCPANSSPYIKETFEGMGIDSAWKIFDEADDFFDPNSDYRVATGILLYLTDKEFPKKSETDLNLYEPKEPSSQYIAMEGGLDAVKVPRDEQPPDVEILPDPEYVDSQEPTVNFELEVIDHIWQPNDPYNARFYIDGKPVEEEFGGDATFELKKGGSSGYGAVTRSLPVELAEGQTEVTVDAVVNDMYGARRVVASKTLPVKGQPRLNQPVVTYKGHKSESTDSSSIPIYEATVVAKAGENNPLNPTNASFVLDTGVDQIDLDVTKENCPTATVEEIICRIEFEVDSRYSDDSAYKQDPDDSDSDDPGHKDWKLGYTFVQYEG